MRETLFFLIIHARVRVRVKRWLSVFRGRLQWEIDYQPLVKQAFAACNNVTGVVAAGVKMAERDIVAAAILKKLEDEA